jgi:tetratricopeptide (TPR) repeat protein
LTSLPQQHEAEEWHTQARAYLGRGAVRDGMRALKRALELAPDLAPAYVDRGMVLLSAGYIDHAADDFEQALCLDPNSGPAYYGRGTARHANGDYLGALEDVQRALALDRDNALTYQRAIGAAYHGLRDHGRAIAQYSALVHEHPEDAASFYGRALCYAAIGRDAQALADLSRSSELLPNWLKPLRARVAVYTRMRKYKLAYADLVKVGPYDREDREQRWFLWIMAHPLRFFAGLIAFMALVLFVVLAFAGPAITPDTVVEIGGPLASVGQNDRGELVLHLQGYPRPFIVYSSDRALLDEASFDARVRPGDQIYLSVSKRNIQDVTSSQSLAAFQIRSAQTVFLSLDATFEARRRDNLLILPLGIVISLLLFILTLGPLLRSPWPNTRGITRHSKASDGRRRTRG